MPIIQVAGIHDIAEARLLIENGVDFLGFPLRLTVHTPDLSDTQAAEVISTLTPPRQAVLITYLGGVQEILTLSSNLKITRVQLHADISVHAVQEIKLANPSLFIIKSLIVRGENLDELTRMVHLYSPYVDGFITDTFDPETGASGATGKTHDWNISREIVAISPRPLILAGGLTAENVRRAILRVRPAGVDVHTGVEGRDGRKDAAKLKLFVEEARAGFAALAKGGGKGRAYS